MAKRKFKPAALLAPLLAPVKRITRRKRRRTPEKNVYFISGMCYNCSVFDELELPPGYCKKYIEWYVPRPDETLQEYSREMARGIDASRPFVLVGYSFGAVVMQEMCRLVQPEMSIVISSFKHPDEVPPLFHAVKVSRLAERMPLSVFESTEFVTGAFNRFVYHTTNEQLSHFMTHTDPVYIKWAVERITEWVPDNRAANLHHIHGTHDQIFSFKQIRNPIPIDGGDHLMVWKKADQVSAILRTLLPREK